MKYSIYQNNENNKAAFNDFLKMDIRFFKKMIVVEKQIYMRKISLSVDISAVV